MAEHEYLHGFDDKEQQRLLRQADYWRESLTPLGLSYGRGERVLEIGCAAGATLAALADRFPGITVAGIDLEPRQIAFARRHLVATGTQEADLRVGDARELPWDSDTFDHVFIMWLLEHLKDPVPVLSEANRVLRPGGTISLTETDYTTFKVLPSSSNWDYLESAQHEFFTRHGNPVVGRQLGTVLTTTGFANVRSQPVGFHFFAGNGNGLRRHVDYVVEFLEPAMPRMANLGYESRRLEAGLAHLRSVPDQREGSMTQIVYRAHAEKAV